MLIQTSLARSLLWLFIVGLSNVALANKKEHVTSLLEIRQNKVVIQQWDLSCGAAALTTLLKYQHGVNTNEKEVAAGLIQRQEYQKNPELLKQHQGFSLLDLKRYTNKIGLIGKGFGKLTFDDLLTMAPILVPINLSGYNHFVIFRGKSGNRILLADPAWGNRTIMLEDFNKAWIKYNHFGHVGFTVTGKQPSKFENQLKITQKDFVTLH